MPTLTPGVVGGELRSFGEVAANCPGGHGIALLELPRAQPMIDDFASSVFSSSRPTPHPLTTVGALNLVSISLQPLAKAH
jgi:hypothetical protein